GVDIEILLPSPYGQVDVPIEAEVRITSREDGPITVEFPNGLLTTDNEALFDIIVADVDASNGEVDGPEEEDDTSEDEVDDSEEEDESSGKEIESVKLTPEEPVVTFPVLITPRKFGAGTLIVDAQAMIE